MKVNRMACHLTVAVSLVLLAQFGMAQNAVDEELGLPDLGRLIGELETRLHPRIVTRRYSGRHMITFSTSRQSPRDCLRVMPLAESHSLKSQPAQNRSSRGSSVGCAHTTSGSTVDASCAQGGDWGDVPLDEACDPNHESNQYILQFKENTVQLMQTVCTYQWAQEVADFDFANAKATIEEQLLNSRALLLGNDVPEDVDTAVIEYLRAITDEQITAFLDQYGNFT
eukprot:1179867-Prorocentrum_minimum.AAC.1